MTNEQQPQPPSAKQNAYPHGPQRGQDADVVYKMSSNENPLGCSAAVTAAVQAAASTLGDYPPFTDITLREALADLHGRGLTPDHFVTGNGGSDVLELIARALLSPGDEAVICRPTFPVYEMTAQRASASVVFVDLDPDAFTYRADDLLGAVTEKTRLLYLCSPNNPTGTLLAADQMAEIMAGLPERVVLVFDEVYYHFVTQEDRPNPIDYVLEDANIVAVHSFSKAYGLAGLRLGYGVAKPEIAQQISALRRPFHLSTPCFAAGLAALGDPSHVNKTVEVTRAGRDWLYGQIRELGLEAWPSQGNFVLLRCLTPAVEWAEKLEQRNILVRPAFGLPDHLRVSVGLPEANRAFVDALAELAAEE